MLYCLFLSNMVKCSQLVHKRRSPYGAVEAGTHQDPAALADRNDRHRRSPSFDHRQKSLNIRMIPFQILACVIIALEIGKQALSLHEGYDLYHLPFHFCSLFIFMLPIMAFYQGKHRQAVGAITSALCASMFLLMLIYPNLIYSGAAINGFFEDYFDFHTVAFHNVVMLEFLLIIALKLHTPAQKGEPVKAILFTVGFCGVSASMAYILKTNFANYYSCNIPPLEALRLSLQGVLGVVLTQILYVLIISVLNILFVLLSYWLYRLIRRLTCGKETVAAQ